jgi:hypothetical protein
MFRIEGHEYVISLPAHLLSAKNKIEQFCFIQWTAYNASVVWLASGARAIDSSRNSAVVRVYNAE